MHNPWIMHRLYKQQDCQRTMCHSLHRLIQPLKTFKLNATIHIINIHQFKLSGDELLREQLMDEENVNMAMILDIMDWYKNAIIKTRELDVRFISIFVMIWTKTL